jgi:hypothetical protein
MLHLKGGNTRSYTVENLPWKRLWTHHKTDYIMNINTNMFLSVMFLGKTKSCPE